jgi:pilus assembly protein Flp/PilA
MKSHVQAMYLRVVGILAQEEGQDLVEYALVVALIALGATVAMKSLGTEISTAFTSITTSLTTAVS